MSRVGPTCANACRISATLVRIGDVSSLRSQVANGPDVPHMGAPASGMEEPGQRGTGPCRHCADLGRQCKRHDLTLHRRPWQDRDDSRQVLAPVVGDDLVDRIAGCVMDDARDRSSGSALAMCSIAATSISTTAGTSAELEIFSTYAASALRTWTLRSRSLGRSEHSPSIPNRSRRISAALANVTNGGLRRVDISGRHRAAAVRVSAA